MEYCVVVAPNPDMLTQLINEKHAEGWEPHGDISTTMAVAQDGVQGRWVQLYHYALLLVRPGVLG